MNKKSLVNVYISTRGIEIHVLMDIDLCGCAASIETLPYIVVYVELGFIICS